MQHRVQNDLETAQFKSSIRIMETPEGYLIGAGTTVGNGVEGWAPGAIFIDTDASQGAQVFVNTNTKASATWTEIADAGVAGGFTLDDAANIAVGTSTGTKIGTATSQKIGFFNATPVVQVTAPTAATAAWQGVVAIADSASGFGFSTLSQASVLAKTVSNIVVRQGELANALSDLGLMA